MDKVYCAGNAVGHGEDDYADRREYNKCIGASEVYQTKQHFDNCHQTQCWQWNRDSLEPRSR